MLRFFRKLRQRLLATDPGTETPPGQTRRAGRFRKYLFYVVMEIFIVIVGILMALQVDAWYEGRLQEKAAGVLYQNTRQQLLEDRRNIEGQIAYNYKHRPQFEFAIKTIASRNRDLRDSLGGIAANLVDYSDFDRQGTIYETIVNSGDVKLLKNEEIKRRLRGLEETYLYINRMETIHYDAIMQMIPQISATINFTSKEIIDQDRLYGPEFQNLFALSLRIIKEKEQVYLRALDEIDALVSMIGEALKQD